MSTSFTTNEWDSDIEDDSNSSEEFMYVKGTPRSPPSPTINSSLYKTTKYEQNNNNHSPSALILEEDDMNDNDIWNSHEDQIQIVKGMYYQNKLYLNIYYILIIVLYCYRK